MKRRTLPRRFAKDEQGSVMVITVVLLLLLTKATLSTYNVGALAAERTRLQITTDAAAYSAAVWQARFLNYCAYARRSIIANYAHIGLITAMESHKAFVDKYYQKNTAAYTCSGSGGISGSDFEDIFEDADGDINAGQFEDDLEDAYKNGDGPTTGIGFEGNGTEDADASDENDAWDELLGELGGLESGGSAPGTVNPDSMMALPRISITAMHPIYDAAADLVMTDEAKAACENLAYLHSQAAQELYDCVKSPIPVVEKIVEEANKANGAATPLKITLPTLYKSGYPLYASMSDGFLNDDMIELRDVSMLEEDIRRRFDNFTASEWNPTLVDDVPVSILPAVIHHPLPNSMPFVMSRPYWALDALWLIDWAAGFGCTESICQQYAFRVTHIAAKTSGMEFSFNAGGMATKETMGFGRYYWGTIAIPTPFGVCIPIPIFGGIDDYGPFEGQTQFGYDKSDIQIFDMKTNDAASMEPSVYVVLCVERSQFLGEDPDSPMSPKKLFHHWGMPIGEATGDMYAISRAKVNFQPRYTDEIFRPNLYYPYWEAQLAPLYGPGRDECNGTLKSNTDHMFQAIALAMGDPVVALPGHLNGIHY